MENQQLRALILKLQDRLSDNDRIRLHFFLGNDVPRRIRDDPSLAGTLRLMDSLFDQDKINETDFSFLIHAFDQIQCSDAVKLLKEYRREILKNSVNTQTKSFTAIMPSFLSQITDDQEADHFQCSIEEPLLSNDPIENTNRTVDIPSNHLVYSFTKFKKFIKPIYLVIIFVLSILVLVSMIQLKQLKINMKRKIDLIYEQNQTIDELRKQLNESEIEKNNLIIKPGRKIGGTGGGSFDDSLLPQFTFTYYLSGIIISNISAESDSCQFIYSSVIPNQIEIQSNVHGRNGENSNLINRYTLAQDERFNKVEVYLYDLQFVTWNGTIFTMQLVRSIVLFTTRGRTISSHSDRTNQMFTEQFENYTIGYVTGKSGLCIDQLQFFWYRTKSD